MNLIQLNLSQPKQAFKPKATSPMVTVGFETPDQYFEIFNGLKTASGKVVSYEQALRCSAVLACVRILAEDIASLPFILKKGTATGAQNATNHPAFRLAKIAPNKLQTSFELREHMMLDLLLTGYFFNWQQRNGFGKLTSITSIPARFMSFSRQLSDGTVIWNCGYPGFPNEFTNFDLWRGTLLNSDLVGARSLMLLSREAIGLAIAAEEQGARLFSQGIQSDLVLEADEEIEDKDQLRDALERRHSGSGKSWLPLLLESGLKAKRIGLTAQESQYIESRNYQLSDIARLFRVPGVMLGLADKSNTFAAAEQFFQAYAKHTLGPWTRRIEETAARDLLLEHESDFFFKHDYSQLLKSDNKTRFETYKVGIESGMMQPQEARQEEDLPELPGLDFTLVPANYAVLRDGILEAVPTSKGAPDSSPEAPKQGPNPPKTAPQPPTNQAEKVAIRAADALIKSECRQFAKARVSEAAESTFAAWHFDKVMECTGTTPEKALEYSTWRLDNRDAHGEATKKLTLLSLEA